MPTQRDYSELLIQLPALLEGETDPIANLANACALLKSQFNFWWVGLYLVREGELVLGPFQGPPACTRIGFGKGVCGTCWQTAELQHVPDVHQFPGHIACSSASLSELVVPIFNPEINEVIAVLDIDSDKLDDFTAADEAALVKVCEYLQTSVLHLLMSR